MINGIISVLVVFLLLGVGFYFTKTKKWPDNTNQVFSTAVVQIAAPALAVVSIENRFTPQMLRASVINLLVITACLLCLHLLGKGLSRLMKLPKKKKAVFDTTFTFNNSMFIGLPIISIIFGHDGLPYLFTFYLVTIILFWSLGAWTLSKASDKNSFKAFSVRRIFSPGLIGVMIGCLLAGLEWKLPVIFETALSYLGDMCVPLSLLVIGSNLAVSVSKGMTRVTIDQLLILAGKFLISPLLIWGALSLAGVSGLPLRVFILCASLPCHAQTAILAQFYDVEGEYASNLVSLSTLVSLITIPVYASILL
ncbi:AEC family transporter [Anaerovorax odorimutans]|uniref:AEC family transporter n=1 Tax=Anaerovorax odorimutans TaxID=109327 RepID=A0ABT1RLH3_9FIRM|nr:AEC family transporter [Anaerovorax odorimutans]MCQ4636023.1 AEC family transporter [Anaerovorax odorimutans]